MAKNIEVVKYTDEWSEKWDRFVLEGSCNGTILQTRRFLSYHGEDRFEDSSLLFVNGSDIIGVLPANIQIEDDKRVLRSHAGSTFGGIVIKRDACKIAYLEPLFSCFEGYIYSEKIDKVVLKQTGSIYQNSNCELLDYYLFMNGFDETKEVGYFIDYTDYPDNVIDAFTASRRRDFRYSLKHDFKFNELTTKDEIELFYSVLCDNYEKFGKKPVHTLEELVDFKKNRLKDEVSFFGVFQNGEIVAGCMAFLFRKKVFHTQYLAVLQSKKGLFVNEFLYKELIEYAKKDGYAYLSFGTSTFEEGRVLNVPLAQYKEGFGTLNYSNRTYFKNF